MGGRPKKDLPLTLRCLITDALRRAGWTLVIAGWVCIGAASGHARLPDEDDCPEVTLQPAGNAPAEDAVPIAIESGMIIRQENLVLLRKLIPKELWRHREVFFYEGMRMQVGPCHRRYRVPEFYRAATERFAGEANIDENGALGGYTAGLPFPQSEIDDKDPKAGS